MNYINFETSRGDFDRVVQLFNTCLPITDNVDVCRSYMLYVRRVNDVITGGEKARTTVVSCFDFAVKKVGLDVESAPLWCDYLDFFKLWTPGLLWEQQQKADLVRKLYRRCLVIPTLKVELIWSDYTKWENEVLPPNSASKFIADLSTQYMEARLWNTAWRHATPGLKRGITPLGLADPAAAGQLRLWLLWLDLERRNDLKLPDIELRARIEHVHKQSTVALPFVPQTWCDYCDFVLERGRCIEILKEGITLNPKSFLLAFKLSELYEKEADFANALGTLNNLIKSLSAQHDDIKKQMDTVYAAIKERSNPPKERSNPPKETEDDSDTEDPMQLVQPTDAEAAKLALLHEKAQDLARAVTLVYVKLMALSKRCEGIKEVRNVFKQRRNFPDLGYEFYVENALFEYHSENRKTADKIFDLAMKQFGKDGAFLYEYLRYLILYSTVDATKAFLELALVNLSKAIEEDTEALQIATTNQLDKKLKGASLARSELYARKIIKRFIRYAFNYVDLETVSSLEQRYKQLFPKDSDLELFNDRYKAPHVNVIAKYDLQLDEAPEEPQRKRRRTQERTPVPVPAAPNGHAEKFAFVGKNIHSLLQALPNAGYFGPPQEHVFNSTRLVELFANLAEHTDA